MARRQRIPVCDYPSFALHVDYLVRVQRVKADLKKRQMLLEVQHLNSDQDGRVQECHLPLPIHPGGLTAQFFVATGIEIAIGHDVEPDEAVGRLVVVRFGPPVDGTSKPSLSFHLPA
jgi:hypothetical protein